MPSHLILCALKILTISAPSVNLSISMLFRVLHTLSILIGPNIFLSICLSKMRKLFYLLLLLSKTLRLNLGGSKYMYMCVYIHIYIRYS